MLLPIGTTTDWNLTIPHDDRVFGNQYRRRAVRLILDANDGGVKRGDRTDTGDEEARPDTLNTDLPDPEDELLGNFEDNPDPDENDMEIVSPFNSRSGVTNTGKRPADDWASDTGPAQTPESIRKG